MEPEFKRTKTKVDQNALFANQKSITDSANSTAKWWKKFGDKQLNAYVEELLRDNLSLQEAAQRVVQAQEQFKINKGGLFPTLSLGAKASRQFQPTNSFAIPGAGGGDRRFFANSFSTDLNTSWEIDLFGRIRSSMKASKANLLATQLDVEALKQSLVAQLVKLRMATLVDHQLLILAKDNVKNKRELYSLTTNRYELGVDNVSLSNVHQALQDLNNSKSQVNLFERQLAQSLYSLDVLLGKVPGSTVIDDDVTFLPNVNNNEVLTCVPASLLDRRWDLRASEFRQIAQNANIGVAIADLYPNFSIGASLGYSSMKSSQFINSDQLAGSLFSSVTAKIFQGGALRANVRLQKSKAKEMALSYSNDVLEAVKEAELALKSDVALQRELGFKKSSFDLASLISRNAKGRYDLGIDSLSDFLQRQSSEYEAKQQWLVGLKARINGRIDLYLAFGGDWFGNNVVANQCFSNVKN